jgi:hypothetical protein
MAGEAIEKYQLAGLDERQRGFSRPVDLHGDGASYRATFRYETVVLHGERCQATESALREMIRLLQRRGYTQLKSQLSFRGGQYLGNQEPWIEYPDDAEPAEEPVRVPGWLRRVGACFRR